MNVIVAINLNKFRAILVFISYVFWQFFFIFFVYLILGKIVFICFTDMKEQNQ